MMIWLKKQSKLSTFFFFTSNFAFSKKMWPRLPSTKCPQKYFLGRNINPLLFFLLVIELSFSKIKFIYLLCAFKKSCTCVFGTLSLGGRPKNGIFQTFQTIWPLKIHRNIFFSKQFPIFHIAKLSLSSSLAGLSWFYSHLIHPPPPVKVYF